LLPIDRRFCRLPALAISARFVDHQFECNRTARVNNAFSTLHRYFQLLFNDRITIRICKLCCLDNLAALFIKYNCEVAIVYCFAICHFQTDDYDVDLCRMTRDGNEEYIIDILADDHLLTRVD
jgi:hypothetical protein